MLEIVVYSLIWCFAIYGILVMIGEIFHKSTYEKIDDNIELIITVKNAQNSIEWYIRSLAFNTNLTIIDLDSQDETMCILKELERENNNIKVFNRRDGEEYLKMQVN